MEFEPWWLLALPLFFALGWWACRLERRYSSRPSEGLGEATASGVTGSSTDARSQALLALLRDAPDEALNVLTQQIGREPDSVALQSALALLYRARGETDRAIRVHQALSERSDIGQSQQHRARLELGVDFIKAGLIDRAEDTLAALAGTEFSVPALRHRLMIAQTVRDWTRALGLLDQLEPSAGESMAVHRMHLHCEVAHSSQDPQQARAAIDAALQAFAEHPRPWLLLGQWAWSQQDARAAAEAWSRLAELSPEHLALVGPAWKDVWRQLADAHEGTRRLEAIASRLPRAAALHRCSQCGFKARRHYWQCPGCSAWDTLPARGEVALGLSD
jgi:lipopolysaccharide biosynthesis regulator YciM